MNFGKNLQHDFPPYMHCSELNIKCKVGSDILICDANPVQVLLYPTIILLNIKTFVSMEDIKFNTI